MANNSQIGLPPSPAGNGTGTNLTPAQVAANAAPQQGTNPAGGIGTTPSIIQSNQYAAPAAPANPGGYGSANSNNPSPYGYDANGNPYGGPTSSNPNPSAANYTTGANVPAPQTEDEIKAQMTTDAQSQIDAINQNFASIIANDTATNAQNYGAGRGALAVRGLLGSADAASSEAGATAVGNRVIAADQSAQATQIAGVYSQIDANALAQANLEKQDAVTDSETYLKNQQSIASQAMSNAASFAAAGVTGQALATNDPTTWAQLQQQTGMSSYALTAYMFSKLPSTYQPTATNSYSADANGNAIQNTVYSYVDPTTGKSVVTQSSVNLGIPYADFNSKNMLTASDGTPIYINSNGQTIDAETGQPYVPTKAVTSGSSLVNPQSGTTIVKGNDKYQVVRSTDLNGNPVDRVFDATTGQFVGTQNSDGTLAQGTTGLSSGQVDTTTVPGMSLPDVTVDDQTALQYVEYLPSGGANVPYIDATATPNSRTKAAIEAYGKQNGIDVITDKTQLQSIASINTANRDMQSESNYILDPKTGAQLLPSDWATRDFGSAANQKISAYLQTDSNKASFSSWQLATIDYVKAIAGGGSGIGFALRSILSDATKSAALPQLTDTLQVAQTKMATIQSEIDAAMDGILPRYGNSASSSGSTSGTTSSGASYTVTETQ